MISKEHKDIAHWAMELALNEGCQQAKVSVHTGKQTSIELENLKVEKLQTSSSNAFVIQLYVDGRFGSCQTNRIDKKEIEQLIKNNIATTRFLAEDPHRSLPDPSRYYTGGMPDLEQCDTQPMPSPDTKKDLAMAVGLEIFNTDPRIISVASSYSDYYGDSYTITSNGFEASAPSTWYSLNSSVSIKGEGEARPSDYWYEGAAYFNELKRDGIAKTALERVLRKIGQKKIKSGNYNMVLDNTVSSRLLSPMISAMNGSALQMKNSFLIDKLGKQIANKKLTLVDNPHIIHANGARYYDYEGVKTEKRTIIDKGVLNTYFIDTYYGNKMGVAPTISGPSILMLEESPLSKEDLFAQAGNGIYVTGFNGGNSNSTTGDFSFGIEGFLIENGKLTQPISEMNITGNLIDLWMNLQATANDERKTSSWRVPSLLFSEVSFSGL